MAGQPIIFGAWVQAAGQGTRKGAYEWTVSDDYCTAGHVGDPDEAVEEGEMGDSL